MLKVEKLVWSNIIKCSKCANVIARNFVFGCSRVCKEKNNSEEVPNCRVVKQKKQKGTRRSLH